VCLCVLSCTLMGVNYMNTVLVEKVLLYKTPCIIVLAVCRSLNHSLGTNVTQSKILLKIYGHFSCPSSHHLAEVSMKTFLMLVGISDISFIVLSLCSYFDVAQICCSASFVLC
jgi:hypothetical protein